MGIRFRPVTFKKRIILIFLVSILTPFVCLGFLSFYTIDSIIDNKVESTIQGRLKQDLLTLENTLNNLNHVSQQLAIGGRIPALIERLHQTDQPYERVELFNEIKSELNVITFSNPNIGLLLFYYPDTGAVQFENFRVRTPFAPERLSIMASYPEITYYGPHRSYNDSINQYVFSTMRQVNVAGRNVYLYIETGRNALETLFAPQNRKSDSRRLLILDNDGMIAFSENREVFPESTRFPAYDAEALSDSGYYGNFFWSKETSNQGWSIVSILPQNELNLERNRWLWQFTGFTVVVLLIAVFFAWLLRKMVYKPLDKFNKEIKSLILSHAPEETELTRIPEFDYTLYQIRSMKRKIWNLYEEIEQKERRRADLEVEKLLYQINPHFLMNTLDTVHWLAVMNGQKEIDRVVLSLNKLLYYNLGKKGETSTIGDEIQALKEYLQLQQIRYDFRFDVDIDVDELALSLPSPRFILQPLVENALYHGVSDDGYIYVGIRLRDDRLEIEVRDNGAGMSRETIDKLLHDDANESEKVGMGIGMRYVRRILKAHYGDKARLEIESGHDRGTTVMLSLPASGGDLDA
ncbi:histidine kinase [Thermobacillus composti KWC4]|jgi:two-component system sensor histidine kinase YesM|uniref:histidine kinase n=1 Tax=Thermobacillus composti (strain DSM 18247 / JCM 13945 / KWC4) TaxID=717605 RepID=L0EGK5_THECK|nr:histidine kinase [Thermobacillus composti]AGA59388.1 histidine kinase [Thermobacillus composti KWC4]